MKNLVLPELGEGIQKATVACWHYKVGDHIQKDDEIVEVVTDKASFNIPAESSGCIRTIFFREGQEAKVGEILATIE